MPVQRLLSRGSVGGAALVALLVHQHTSTVLSAAFNEWVGSVGVFFQLMVSPTTT